MSIVSRYLSIHLIAGIAMSLLVLTVLVSVIDFIGELDDLGENGYTASKAFIYILLGFASSAYTFFPVAVLIGSAISLNNLADRFELLALSVLGYSRYGIGLILLGLGAILMAVMFLFGEWVVPAASMKAYEIKYVGAVKQHIMHETANGYWLRRGANYIFFKQLDGLHRGIDVKVYQIDESSHHLQRIFYAKRSQLTSDSLVLEGVRLVELDDHLLQSIRQFPTYSIPILQASDRLMSGQLVPEAMNLWQLYQHIQFLDQNYMNNKLYQLAFWTRLSMVLTIPIMLLLALLWAFSPPRTDHVKRRVFAAILLGVVYVLFSRLTGSASIIWDFPASVGAFSPLVIFLPLAFYLFRRL